MILGIISLICLGLYALLILAAKTDGSSAAAVGKVFALILIAIPFGYVVGTL